MLALLTGPYEKIAATLFEHIHGREDSPRISKDQKNEFRHSCLSRQKWRYASRISRFVFATIHSYYSAVPISIALIPWAVSVFASQGPSQTYFSQFQTLLRVFFSQSVNKFARWRQCNRSTACNAQISAHTSPFPTVAQTTNRPPELTHKYTIRIVSFPPDLQMRLALRTPAQLSWTHRKTQSWKRHPSGTAGILSISPSSRWGSVHTHFFALWWTNGRLLFDLFVANYSLYLFLPCLPRLISYNPPYPIIYPLRQKALLSPVLTSYFLPSFLPCIFPGQHPLSFPPNGRQLGG